jgi:phosphopantothenoylcysteine decarboxylase/phosphopantothenate--cysteine ligase
MKRRCIVVGVTGSIACYKAVEIVSKLAQLGHDVRVVMTQAAQEFVRPLTFETLSGNRVVAGMFEPNETYEVKHVALAERAALLLIAPASANIIGKLAAGIADDALSTLVLAAKCPVLIAPAMNYRMYKNPIMQANVKRLAELGYSFIGPEKGRLACGPDGVGRLAPIKSILEAVTQKLGVRNKK